MPAPRPESDSVGESFVDADSLEHEYLLPQRVGAGATEVRFLAHADARLALDSEGEPRIVHFLHHAHREHRQRHSSPPQRLPQHCLLERVLAQRVARDLHERRLHVPVHSVDAQVTVLRPAEVDVAEVQLADEALLRDRGAEGHGLLAQVAVHVLLVAHAAVAVDVPVALDAAGGPLPEGGSAGFLRDEQRRRHHEPGFGHAQRAFERGPLLLDVVHVPALQVRAVVLRALVVRVRHQVLDQQFVDELVAPGLEDAFAAVRTGPLVLRPARQAAAAEVVQAGNQRHALVDQQPAQHTREEPETHWRVFGLLHLLWKNCCVRLWATTGSWTLAVPSVAVRPPTPRSAK